MIQSRTNLNGFTRCTDSPADAHEAKEINSLGAANGVEDRFVPATPTLSVRTFQLLEKWIDANGNGYSPGDFMLMGVESAYHIPISTATLVADLSSQWIEVLGEQSLNSGFHYLQEGSAQLFQNENSFSTTIGAGKTVFGMSEILIGQGLDKLAFGLQKAAYVSGFLLGKLADGGDQLWSGIRTCGGWFSKVF